MTAIAVHRDGWIAADQLSTIGPTKGPFVVHKILDFGHTLIAVAGPSVFKQKFNDELTTAQKKTPKSIKKALVQHLREAGHCVEAVLVNTDGYICKFAEEGCEYPLKQDHDFIAIGSGGSEVLGWLAACEYNNGTITPEDAVDAIKYASSVVLSVNEDVDVVHLKGKN